MQTANIMLAIGGDGLFKKPLGHPGRGTLAMLQTRVFIVAIHMGGAIGELNQPERTGCANIMLEGAEFAFHPWSVSGDGIVAGQRPAAKSRGSTRCGLAAGIAHR